MKRSLFLTAVFVLASLAFANADVILLETAPEVGSATVNWSQLGASFATIPHAFAAFSSNSDTVFGSFAPPNSNTGQVRVQGTSWNGDFTRGEYLIYTINHGPVTFLFDTGFHDVGAYIQPNFFGGFTAKLQVYNGTTLLGTVTENGVSTDLGDGSATFIGALDTAGPNITKAVFSVVGSNDFALGTMYLSSVPEPGTLVLLGSGLIGLAGLARFRRK